MRLQFNQLVNPTLRFLRESIVPAQQAAQRDKVLIVALIAFAFLATFFYYALRKNSQPVTPSPAITPKAPLPLMSPKSDDALDKAFRRDEVLEDKDDSKKESAAKTDSPKSQPEDKSNSADDTKKGASSEDDDFEKARILSMQDLDTHIKPEDSDLEAAIEASKKMEEERLQAILLESKKDAKGVIDVKDVEKFDDSEMEEALRQSEEDLKKKQDEELAEVMKLSLKQKSGTGDEALQTKAKPLPQPPKPKDPPKPADAKGSPAPKKDAKAKESPIDAALLETTKAKSHDCVDSLDLAVAKAKENRKIKITKHEVKRNGANNAYLVLHFTTTTSRTRAVEELRSKYSMFKKKEPTRNGDTELELTVEQTIEFENAF